MKEQKKKAKKPDAVVFDEKTQQYDAHLKPYATSVGAPVITPVDTTSWKNTNINRVNHEINARYEELRAQYQELLEEFEYNKLVYSSKFNFEPIIGETYHLYRDKNTNTFLSVIAPNECNFDHVGSFRLKADTMWEKL